MDEIIEKQSGNSIIITDVVLNNQKNIRLLRGYEEDYNNKKRYMRNIVIMIEDEFITSNIADTMLLKEELNLFEKGDDQNKFFKITTRTVDKKIMISLKLTLTNKKDIFISKSEAKAICKLFDMSLQGYSFARLLEFETKQTAQTWTLALEYYGYLELEYKND
jgi:hypothetical protein